MKIREKRGRRERTLREDSEWQCNSKKQDAIYKNNFFEWGFENSESHYLHCLIIALPKSVFSSIIPTSKANS